MRVLQKLTKQRILNINAPSTQILRRSLITKSLADTLFERAKEKIL